MLLHKLFNFGHNLAGIRYILKIIYAVHAQNIVELIECLKNTFETCFLIDFFI